ncbi:MAG: hypothetical protein Q7U13_06150, partial [Rhodoferax sp.]|nr:hypothetical protein [Rhodoferax sp.]
VIGLPLAYAVFRAHDPRVRAAARVLYQLPVALPALVLAFGFIMVFSSDTLPWLGSIWLLIEKCPSYFPRDKRPRKPEAGRSPRRQSRS